MSDLYGEYDAFYHILNNCSGVIKEKVKLVFGDTLSKDEQRELCTLIYYPKEKLELLEKEGRVNDNWYRMTLYQLIKLAKVLSSKYTRSKMRKALPADFAYIIDELIHVQKDEDDNQVLYHQKIMDSILIFVSILCKLGKFHIQYMRKKAPEENLGSLEFTRFNVNQRIITR